MERRKSFKKWASLLMCAALLMSNVTPLAHVHAVAEEIAEEAVVLVSTPSEPEKEPTTEEELLEEEPEQEEELEQEEEFEQEEQPEQEEEPEQEEQPEQEEEPEQEEQPEQEEEPEQEEPEQEEELEPEKPAEEMPTVNQMAEPLAEEGSSNCTHYFENGVCLWCGLENTCIHEHTTEQEGYTWNDDAVANDGKTHHITENKYQVWRCSDCGEQRRTLIESYEKDMQHNYGSDNVCYQCGYENTCTHPNATTTTFDVPKEGATWTPNADGKTHSIECKRYENWSCSDCNGFKQTCIDENATWTENHWFSNGECPACHLVNECKHENKTENVRYDQIDGETWKDDGNGRTHTRKIERCTSWYCSTCRESGTIREEATETKVHDFQNGECVCGAKSGCAHEHLIDQYESYELGDAAAQDDGNGLTHSITGKKFLRWTCSDCGEQGKTLLDENATKSFAHEFDADGVCVDCGAKTTCEHEWEESFEYSYPSSSGSSYYRWTDNGDGTHSRDVDVTHVFTCAKCGAVRREENVEKLVQKEPHNLSGGNCYLCGYHQEQTCDHEHQSVEDTYIRYNYPRIYTPSANGKTHTFVGLLNEQIKCDDCGEFIENRVVKELTIEEVHVFDDMRVCKVCGYVEPNPIKCAHENVMVTRQFEQDDSDWVARKENHTHTIDIIEETICLDCGVVIKTECVKQGLVRTEEHDFYEGVCMVCGYIRDAEYAGCKHEHQETVTATRNLEIKSADENGHTMLVLVTDEVGCNDCMTYLTSTNPREDTLTEAHTFAIDGTCTVCGYKMNCKHKNIVEEEMHQLLNEGFTYENAQQHSFEGYKGVVRICEDCGLVLGEYFETEAERVLEDHFYDDEGICGGCGAKEPEPTPTPEPTPEPTPDPTEEPTVEPTPEPTEEPVEEPTSEPTTEPTEAPTVRPTPTPTPVPTEEPVETPTPEPAASEEMVRAFEELEELEQLTKKPESGEETETKIEVVGAKEALEEAEYEQLQELPVQEQILVTLSSVGCEEVMQSIVQVMNLVLSEKADDLVTQVRSRIEATELNGTVEEVEKKMEAAFPVHEVEIDGVSYRFYVIVVNIETNGVKRTVYFGFRLDENGQWQMVRLAEADLDLEQN